MISSAENNLVPDESLEPVLYNDRYSGIFARLYDRLFPYQGDHEFIIDLARIAGAPVLEMFSLTGEIALQLAKEKIRVVGLETADDMIFRSNRTLARMPASVQKIVDFKKVVVENVEIEETFKCIYFARDSFKRLLTKKAQLDVLRVLFSKLENLGLFILDISIPDPVTQVNNHGKQSRMWTVDTDSGDEILVTTTAYVDFFNQLELAKIQLDVFRGTTHIERHIAQHRERFTWPSELEYLIEKVGFKIMNIWGGYRKEPLSRKSTNLILLARKQGG